MPAANDGTQTVQIWSQGSHALAHTDVTIDLQSGHMTGKTFELDDSDVTTVRVDETLAPEELSRFRDALMATCVRPEVFAGEAMGAPGGSSRLVIDGRLRIVFGAPRQPVPAGQRVATVDRETWSRITEAYPAIRPSER